MFGVFGSLVAAVWAVVADAFSESADVECSGECSVADWSYFYS